MQTIGEQLKQARLLRDLTLSDAAKATAIRLQYLKALEEDEFEVLPSPIQVRGFLRNYAAFLGLQPEILLNQLQSSAPPAQGIRKVEEFSSSLAASEPTGSPATDLENENILSQPVGLPSSDGTGTGPTVDRSAEAFETASPEASGEIASGLIPFSPSSVDERSLTRDGDETYPLEKQADITSPLSQSIFIEIGQQLRLRRELLSLSLEEIERHTRIPRNHLITMEEGRFDDLPSSVQARGALTTYARFIDLNSETILLRFADALQAQRSERHPLPSRPRRARASERSLASIRRFLSTDLVFGGGLVLVIAIFAIWGAARVITIRSQKTDAVNAQSISQVLLATQVAAPTPSPTTSGEPTAIGFLPAAPLSPSATPTAFPTRFSTAAVQLIVISNDRTWMRVTVDGKIQFEGRTTPGNAYSFDGQKQIELLAADAGAIQLIYNRDNIGSPGNPGGVVDLIYTANAVLLPTPTITPSPTRTLRPSATPRPTSTPRFTPTPPGTPQPIG